MSNFWARTITGLSMVFILLAGLYFTEWIFAGLFFIITVLGIREFYGIVSSGTCHPQKAYGLFAGAVLYLSLTVIHYIPLSMRFFEWTLLPFFIPIPLFFIPFIIEIYRNKPEPLKNIAFTILPVFYIALPLALLNVMNDRNALHFIGFPVYLTAFFLLTWSYDTGAYLYGRQFGKTKLFERISPKKTWEGTLGGAGAALLVALGLYFLVKEIALVDWIALTIIILVFSTFGDLIESLIKRNYSMKDSGSILPGHGGILDRFDSVFVSAPFVFLYFYIRFA